MSFFSQFKSLAKHVETGVAELQKEIVEESTSNCETNHAAAINQMHHTVKEVRDMHEKTQHMTDDFVRRSDNFTNTFHLFKKVLESHEGRLVNVEDHMEKYGFKRLNIEPEPSVVESESVESREETSDTEETKVENQNETESNGDTLKQQKFMSEVNDDILTPLGKKAKSGGEFLPTRPRLLSSQCSLFKEEIPDKSSEQVASVQVKPTAIADEKKKCDDFVLPARPKLLSSLPDYNFSPFKKPSVVDAPLTPRVKNEEQDYVDIPQSPALRSNITMDIVPPSSPVLHASMKKEYCAPSRPTLLSSDEDTLCSSTAEPQLPVLSSSPDGGFVLPTRPKLLSSYSGMKESGNHVLANVTGKSNNVSAGGISEEKWKSAGLPTRPKLLM